MTSVRNEAVFCGGRVTYNRKSRQYEMYYNIDGIYHSASGTAGYIMSLFLLTFDPSVDGFEEVTEFLSGK